MFALVIAPFSFGAIIGSFLNVVAHRVPSGGSLMRPRSHCPSCGVPIKPYDNIPIVSWILLRGRCRSCSAHISSRYPLIELMTGLLFAAVVLINGVDSELPLELFFVAMLMAVAAIDLEHRIIPNKILAIGAAVAIGG